MQETRDAGSTSGSGRSPGGRHGNPLQYSCLENPLDRGVWRSTVRRVTKSWTRPKQLSTHTYCRKLMKHMSFLPFTNTLSLFFFFCLELLIFLQDETKVTSSVNHYPFIHLKEYVTFSYPTIFYLTCFHIPL